MIFLRLLLVVPVIALCGFFFIAGAFFGANSFASVIAAIMFFISLGGLFWVLAPLDRKRTGGIKTGEDSEAIAEHVINPLWNENAHDANRTRY